jgi:hypothetical protein
MISTVPRGGSTGSCLVETGFLRWTTDDERALHFRHGALVIGVDAAGAKDVPRERPTSAEQVGAVVDPDVGEELRAERTEGGDDQFDGRRLRDSSAAASWLWTTRPRSRRR